MSNPIGWCEETINFFVGCDKVSPGCENCYAIRMAYRLAHIPGTKSVYGPVVKKTAGGKLNWTGVIMENTKQWEKPLKTKKPTRFFVNSMSDLFHENISFEQIDTVYAIMRDCPQHTFQILTKRPQRMLEWYKWKADGNTYKCDAWPLQNVWIGISAEDQKRYDERLEYLLQCPASVRFLSCEPLLGNINLSLIGTAPKDWGYGYRPIGSLLHWIIIGGESGHGARPMHPDWVRKLISQAKEDEIPVYFKQWGAFQEGSSLYRNDIVCLNNGSYAQNPSDLAETYGGSWTKLIPTRMSRVGKHNSGKSIDGKEYLEFPEAHKQSK